MLGLPTSAFSARAHQTNPPFPYPPHPTTQLLVLRLCWVLLRVSHEPNTETDQLATRALRAMLARGEHSRATCPVREGEESFSEQVSGPLVPGGSWGLAFEELVGMCSFLLKAERWRAGLNWQVSHPV